MYLGAVMKIKNIGTVTGLSLSIATMSSFSSSALANDVDLSLSGFATFAYARAIDEDRQEAMVATDANGLPAQGTVSGYDYQLTEEGEYRDYNKFGLRLTADLQHDLLVGAQLIANGEDDYEPDFDWLYAQYNFTPNLSVKVGKTTAPLFMYSDYLDATYAYMWLDAPYEVYGSGTVKSNEGLVLDWKANMGGGWSSLLTVFAGKVDELVPQFNTNVVIDNGVGVAWDVEYEWLRLRAVAYDGKSSVEGLSDQVAGGIAGGLNAVPVALDAQADALEALNPADPAVAVLRDAASTWKTQNDTIAVSDIYQYESYKEAIWEDSDAAYYGLGFGLDFEYVFFTAEATRVDIEDTLAVGLLDSWYAMIGGRLPGNWSIAFTYGVNDDSNTEYDYDQMTAELFAAYNTTASVPPYQPGVDQAQLAAVDSVVQGLSNTFESARYEETESYTLSSRWDFHRSASFKMELMQQSTKMVDLTLNEVKRKPSAFRVGVDLVF